MENRPGTLRLAKSLRGSMSLPEVMLWNAIRRKAVAGARFRRQHPFGPYVLDFFCDDAALAVEVDGAHHADERQAEADWRRDRYLEAKGVRTLRIPAVVVLKNLETAVEMIRQALGPADENSGPPLPSR